MSAVKYFIVVTDGDLKGWYVQPTQFAPWNIMDIIGLEGTPAAFDDEDLAHMMRDTLTSMGLKVAIERGGPSDEHKD